MSHPGNSAILERLYEEAIEMGLDEDAAILYAERKMEEMEFLTEGNNSKLAIGLEGYVLILTYPFFYLDKHTHLW